MSIKEAIRRHCSGNEAQLRLQVPVRRSSSITRDVYVGPQVQELLDAPASLDSRFHRQGGRARAIIDSFSSGHLVTFAMDPHNKKRSSKVARVGPIEKGIVDVRVTDPRPMVRIFGGFAATDVLILLTWANRDGLNFRAEVHRCRAEWDRLFPGMPPFFASRIEDYVSNNFDIG